MTIDLMKISTLSRLGVFIILTPLLYLGAVKGTGRAPLGRAGESGFAEVNGTRLYYEVAGKGTPLVLIHGLSLNRKMWDDQFNVLAEHYRVIRYDLRGHGNSSSPDKPYSQIEDLYQLLRFLGVEKAVLVGHSLGGGDAIDFTLTHPEKVLALVTVGTSLGGFTYSDELGARYVERTTAAREKGVKGALQVWFNDPLFKSARENPEVWGRLEPILAEYSCVHWLRPGLFARLDPPAMQRLSEIKVPTLAIVGEKDVSDFHRIADLLQTGIPKAQKGVIRGGGHMINMENPKAFNQVLTSRIAEVMDRVIKNR
jgi:pimeloyl-ACP methyl ester carboxylesterase